MLFSMLLDANRLWFDGRIGLMARAHHRCMFGPIVALFVCLWLAHEGTPPLGHGMTEDIASHSRSS